MNTKIETLAELYPTDLEGYIEAAREDAQEHFFTLDGEEVTASAAP